MNISNFAFGMACVLFVAYAGGCSPNKSSSPPSTTDEFVEGAHLLPRFNPNAVESIRISQDDAWIEMRLANGTWTVVDNTGAEPAHFPAIRELIARVWDVKIGRVIALGAAEQASRFDLPSPESPNKGTKLEFFDKDGAPLARLTLGKVSIEAPVRSAVPGYVAPSGRYVSLPSVADRVFLIEEQFSYVTTDKNFFRIPKETPEEAPEKTEQETEQK